MAGEEMRLMLTKSTCTHNKKKKDTLSEKVQGKDWTFSPLPLLCFGCFCRHGLNNLARLPRAFLYNNAMKETHKPPCLVCSLTVLSPYTIIIIVIISPIPIFLHHPPPPSSLPSHSHDIPLSFSHSLLFGACWSTTNT